MPLPWWLLLSATISTTEGPTTSTRQSKSRYFHTFCAWWKFCRSSPVNLFLNCCPVGACIPWLNFTAPPSWRGTIWSSARRSWARRYDKWLHKVKKIFVYKTWMAHFDPLCAVSCRAWTSSATSRSASLSTCSTCLTSASSPLTWPFTSSGFSQILHSDC